MKNLNDYFLKYDEDNRLNQSDYEIIREKRDLILKELREDENVTLSFSPIVLGSAKLLTGVKYEDGNYDIDCGIRMNIKESEIDNYSAKACKDSVYKAISKYRDPKYKTKCITAVYYREDEPLFHIDFPVFAYDSDSGSYYIADGKASDGVEWKKSYPEELLEHLTIKDDNYRRLVRLLKIWNYHAFKNKRKNSKAPSVALSLETRNWFKENSYSSDLEGLIGIANRLKKRINGNKICLDNPFDGANIFYKMNEDEECVSIFAEQLDIFISKLNETKNANTTSIHNACEKLRKVFPDFPQAEKEKAEESFGTNARYA